MLKRIDNVILIGTSHVSKDSTKEIKEAIKLFKPKIICIELDENRLKSLLEKKRKKEKYKLKEIKEIGLGGYIFAKIGGFLQNKIGKSLNIDAGSDMKTAYIIGKKEKLEIRLIDQDIRITLQKISSIKTLKKIKLFLRMLTSGFRKENRKLLKNLDIKNIQNDTEFINTSIKIFKREVPELYNILIEDRNKYMTEKILECKRETNENILVVIGAGHIPGITKLLQEEFKKMNNIFNIKFTLSLEDEET